MLSFESDYIIGAHEKVLEALCKTNNEVLSGYGNDIHTKRAEELIKNACCSSESEVFFLTGGTQANAVVISTMLRNFEGVISAKTGHIALHEVGAIEFTGHKVIELDGLEGKLPSGTLESYLEAFYGDENNSMMVRPAMVYISHPTEDGTLYSKSELTKLREICDKYEMKLFLDGARLGYGLMSEGTDVTLPLLAKLCDAFYIGGTKVGAMFGEAVVITNPALLKNFMPLVKQHGALLAKGRLLGLQFEALFTDNLYERIACETVGRAMRLRDIFNAAGYPVVVDSPTNQQFFTLPNTLIDKLKEEASFEIWGPRGESESTVRFVTGWSTTDEDIETLKDLMA